MPQGIQGSPAVLTAVQKQGYFAAVREGAQSAYSLHGIFEFTVAEDHPCRMNVGDRVFLLQPGEYLLLPPESTVSCRPTVGNQMCRRSSFWFTPAFAGSESSDNADALLCRLLPALRVLSDIPLSPLTVGFDAEGTLRAHVRALRMEVERPDVGTDATVRRCLTTLFAYLWRSTVLSDGSDRATVNFIKRTVEEEYAHELSLSTIFDLADGSQKLYTLSRLFQRGTGMTFRDYLLRTRAEKACELLKNTDMTVAKISVSVGYNDASFFYKAFCRVIGETPRDYRIEARKASE